MTNSYFRPGADGPNGETNVDPEPWARGPWAADMMHGRLLGGLAARQLEAEFGGEGWRVTRLTVDLFRPSAMDTVTIRTEPVRSGRRLRVADAHLSCGGHAVGRVTAVVLPTSEEPPGSIWSPLPSHWPDPDSLAPLNGPSGTGSDEGGAGAGDGAMDGWLIRGVEGGFGTGDRTRVWTNDTFRLVGGEPMSPLVRAAISGDLACPLANSGDQGLFFINADYTMLLGRYPVGDWVGLEVDQRIGADGLSVASATLVDQDGPFATSGGTSLARPPLTDVPPG